ncbi:hypothetical protein MB02_14125 [Croceicoccus estronivorus]|nr:hypothetical protein MB02_14125 [Croceicoccus estronivorus]
MPAWAALLRIARGIVICLWALAAAAPATAASPLDQALLRLREQDVRLARLGQRLAQGNARLCDETMPFTGLVLHAVTQYAPSAREAAQRLFLFAQPVSVEAVLPSSPADAAGVQANDGLVSINGAPVDDGNASARQSSEPRDRVEQSLAALPIDQPINFGLRRGGEQITASVQPVPVCRSRFEVVWNDKTVAHSDGEIIQISSSLLDRFDDGQLAVLLAHELAHTILRHRDRLEAADVANGLLAEFGRNRRLNRQAEDEADLLSIHLLYNAGFDPRTAPDFWRGAGKKLDPGLLRSRIYRSPRQRAAAMDKEIERLPDSQSFSKAEALLRRRYEPLE